MLGRSDAASLDLDDIQPFQIYNFAGCNRFLPESFYRLLRCIIPASVLRKQQERFAFAKEKVQRRLHLEAERPDFLHHILDHSLGRLALTEAETEKTATTMIVAGSNATGTLLAAILSHLTKHPDFMGEVVREIHSAYSSRR